MKRKMIFVLMMSLLFAVMTTPAFAGTSEALGKTQSIIVQTYDDGSYAIIETVEVPHRAMFAAAATKSASRTYTYYNSKNVAAWTFTLKGTFTYDGSTAKATAASNSYNIHVSGWKCSARSSSTSGAIAKANGTFKYANLIKNTSLGLKCSPSGVISAV
ncbi:hypothetical protein M2140_002052 [Clostridiales Family XIII bacterium PM5-7]